MNEHAAESANRVEVLLAARDLIVAQLVALMKAQESLHAILARALTQTQIVDEDTVDGNQWPFGDFIDHAHALSAQFNRTCND